MEAPLNATCQWCGKLILLFDVGEWVHGHTLLYKCQQIDGMMVRFAEPPMYVIEEEAELT